MTGGVDEDYGSPSSSQVPTEGPDEYRSGDVETEGATEVSRDSSAASELEMIPRPSRPFRAWGAAHEEARPSLWERFVGWVRSLFSRTKSQEPSETFVIEEIAVAEEQAVLVGEHIPLEELPPPSSDAEPLWDTPIVAEPSAEAPPSLEASDFSEVWNQRKSPLDGIDWKALEEKPAKPGFFARLFSRKKVEDPSFAGDEPFEDLTAREPADADFAVDALASSAPTDDDFAVDAVASTAPADDDFAAPTPAVDEFADDFADEPVINPPSLDHSAADSANLAAFLGSASPVEEEVEQPLIEEPLTETPVSEAPPLDERPIVPEPKKAGFFSGLLKRVSRSQFIPKPALEPEPMLEPELPPPAMEAAVEPEPVEELPVVEAQPEPDDLAAKYGPPAAEVQDLGDTVPVPMPAVPRPTPLAAPMPPAESLESTQPFTAFRDARDDFAEEDAATNNPVASVADEGEKTDEFEVVPMAALTDRTAETRMVPGFFGRVFGKKVEEAASSGESPTLEAQDDKIPFVLAKFRSFYNEVIRDKHQKSDVIAGFATAVMNAGGAGTESDPEFAAQLLSKRLSEMLELQAAESNWTGGDAAKYYPEAQYAMVALADETFATIDWPGRSSWHKYMLEPKMYGTRGAEIEFFKRIDKLLKESPNEKGARDLARLYLMVIASGYRGKFRVPNVRRPLAEYRRRLYEYSHQSDPLELYARDRRVFPQAAENTLVSRSVGRFTPAQKWTAVVLVLAALYIGVSHYAWRTVSADLRDVMSRIQSSISQSAPR